MDELDRLLTLCCWASLAIIAALIGSVFYLKFSYEREDAVARSAQELEIAEGVTLMRGLLAFFGRGSRWKVSKNLVYVQCWFLGANVDEDEPVLVLCVDPEPGRIEVVSCSLDGWYDTKSLIDALIQAASKR